MLSLITGEKCGKPIGLKDGNILYQREISNSLTAKIHSTIVLSNYQYYFLFMHLKYLPKQYYDGNKGLQVLPRIVYVYLERYSNPHS